MNKWEYSIIGRRSDIVWWHVLINDSLNINFTEKEIIGGFGYFNMMVVIELENLIHNRRLTEDIVAKYKKQIKAMHEDLKRCIKNKAFS